MQANRCWEILGGCFLAGCLLGGCVAHAQAGGYGDANAPVVFSEPPTLVNIDADVWVIEDANDTVYYVDGYYWSQAGGAWRRSRFYDKAWAPVEVTAVPATIVARDHRSYVHYHRAPGARTRPAPRESIASDPGPRRDDRASGKEERKDEHAERKEEHKDEQAARKEERKDEHAERKDEHAERKEERKDEHAERKDEHRAAEERKKDDKRQK
jgi:hypothetical protein